MAIQDGPDRLQMKTRFPWQHLTALGILGINQRNAEYISRYNPRNRYPLVDDKRHSKMLAAKQDIPVPELYGTLEIEHQIEELPAMIKSQSSFVIKPARGSGGEGILIIDDRTAGGYLCVNGHQLTHAQVTHHVSNILSGMYSLGGKPDVALVEYRVDSDPVFSAISFKGIPDIRTLVFRGIPVMSMLRLPSRSSNGKANLHQGAVGAGIHMRHGTTRGGIWYDSPVGLHPDTGNELGGVIIPGWESILRMNARCHDCVGMGFIGVDIVLDKRRGPLLLEINARPGLSIQMANRSGLLPRLKLVESLQVLPDRMDDRIALAMSLE
jgi:alpha-L-glutamate ligase-like protein